MTRRHTRLILLVGYWCTIFASTHLPGSVLSTILPFQIEDFILHLGTFFGLAVLATWTWTPPQGSWRGWLAILAIILAYAALDELTQELVPGRGADIWDWIADLVGATMGLWFGCGLNRKWQLCNLRVVCLVAAHLPFVVLHFGRLWAWDEFRFYPLLLAAVGWLSWRRWPAEMMEHGRTARFAASVLVAAAVLVLVAAIALLSTWLGTAAGILALGGILVRSTGNAFRREFLPLWLLLWLLLPLPPEWYAEWSGAMRSAAAQGASAVLDRLGVLHLASGDYLRFAGADVDIREFCHGARWVYPLVVCTCVGIVVLRRPWLGAAMLLASVLGWVVLVDVASLVGRALAAQRFGADWSSGWIDFSGAACACGLILLLVASTDRVIGFCYGLLSMSLIGLLHFLGSILGWLLYITRISKVRGAWKAPARKEDPSQLLRVDKGTADLAASPDADRATTFLYAGLIVLELIGFLGVAPAAQGMRSGAAHAVLDGKSLPQEVDGWRQYEVNDVRRAVWNGGGRSRIWAYRAEKHTAAVSLDFTDSGWLEPSELYRRFGWAVVHRQVRMLQAEVANGELACVEVELVHGSGGTGHLTFALFDDQNRVLKPPDEKPGFVERFRERFASSPGLWIAQRAGWIATTASQPVFRFCVFSQGNDDRPPQAPAFLPVKPSRDRGGRDGAQIEARDVRSLFQKLLHILVGH